MELKLKALYEPLDIEIGDVAVHAEIDLTDENCLRISEVCATAKRDMEGVEAMLRKAEDQGDAKLTRKMNRKAAEIMEPVIRQAIGSDAYDAIVEACGAGRKIAKESCNIVMAQVFSAIAQEVADRQSEFISKKAAHYLAEAGYAQTEPDKGDQEL